MIVKIKRKSAGTLNEAIKLNNTRIVNRHIKVDRVEELFRFFHLSEKVLHKRTSTFTFNPRVPRTPYQDGDGYRIEDDFTKRISLATTIQNAVDAISQEENLYYHVYASDIESRFDDDIDTIPLKLEVGRCKDTLSIPPNAFNPKNTDTKGYEYNSNYNLYKFIKYHNLPRPEEPDPKTNFGASIGGPSGLPRKYRDMFYACVPDAENHNEYWSLKDTKMYYLGIYDVGSDYIMLSAGGEKLIKAIEQEESSKNIK